MLNNADGTNRAELIEQLTLLEYAIRKSMTVREDQDEPADTPHLEEAERYGISADNATTKEELLNAVQTLVRATRKKNSPDSGNAP